ncbi:MAG: TerC family protein [Bacteroidia bacterium]
MQIAAWVGFHVLIGVLLLIDLKIVHRHPHEIKLREALGWSAFWIGLALLFNAGIWIVEGSKPAVEFLTAYLVEKSLSVDNLFVFLMIFGYFNVPPHLQHRVLFWGILGALVMRAIFIFGGLALITNFHWITYVLGAILIYGGVKMFSNKSEGFDPGNNRLLKAVRSVLPVLKSHHGELFLVRRQGKVYVTPLLLTLISIELSDVAFALDSIPAVLAISQDAFIVYTSNIFALLGLRSLYFALSGIMSRFHYLPYGLGIILIFVAVKLIIQDFYKIPPVATLSFIAVVLTATIVLSLKIPAREEVANVADRTS